GFDEYWRGELRQYHASHDLNGAPFPDAPRLVTDTRFRVVVQTEAALSFLDRRAADLERPWFLYLAWFAPHVPLESPEPWFSQTPAQLPEKRRQALAMIAAMDDGLGRIRARLGEMGQAMNTLIFFIGDNGAPLGAVWDGSVNLPMRGQKGMLSEGGIRTPFVAAWPGRIPAGQTCDQPVISLDVAATAVALAGLPADDTLDGVNLLPYLTGENRGAPHEALYWRWVSQSAVLEMPYKLIKLGNRPPLLFDVTHPEGENIERDLAAKHPDIAARLEKKLAAWAAGLRPPGLATEDSAFSRHHEDLFAEHRIIAPAPRAPAETGGGTEPEGSIRGWICRNGTIAVRDGALVVTPAAEMPGNARPFLACASLALEGPLVATLRIRARAGGESTITWRTRTASFTPQQSARFDWPAGPEWQEVKVELPEKSRILHLRVTPARGASGVEVQSIVLRDSHGQTREFDFRAVP
ncbi:MAG: sulfatase-like hydrolase/transferase, partial [Lentisphaeria bacterium]|nr:sulfatase-like hydrolase/transferase [Lentisphaeria bacterium]